MELAHTEAENTKKKPSRNLGIEMLRMFLCFRIVLLHYCSPNNKIIKSLKRNRFQVSCFFFISFYFLFPILSNRDNKKLRIRLERLLIPYIIYPFVIWIINDLMFLLIKFNRYNRLLTLNDLKKQLIIGRGIYGISILWFHFNLILFTIFFSITSFILQNYFLTIFQTLALITYILQYTQINYLYFIQYTENIWMSVGNLVETFPIAIIAFSISNIYIKPVLLKNRKKFFFFSIFLFFIISNYDIFSNIKGFSSNGIKHIFTSLFLFISFSIIPFDILNSKILVIINQITRYTQGIYCLHFLFQYYLKLKFDKEGTFIGCIFLYIISYFVSLIGFKIFSQTKLKFLFS